MTTIKISKHFAKIIYFLASAEDTSAGKIVEEAVRAHYQKRVEAAEIVLNNDKEEDSHAHQRRI